MRARMGTLTVAVHAANNKASDETPSMNASVRSRTPVLPDEMCPLRLQYAHLCMNNEPKSSVVWLSGGHPTLTLDLYKSHESYWAMDFREVHRLTIIIDM